MPVVSAVLLATYGVEVSGIEARSHNQLIGDEWNCYVMGFGFKRTSFTHSHGHTYMVFDGLFKCIVYSPFVCCNLR